MDAGKQCFAKNRAPRRIKRQGALLYARISLLSPKASQPIRSECWPKRPVQNPLHNEPAPPAWTSRKHSCQRRSLEAEPITPSASCPDFSVPIQPGIQSDFGPREPACAIAWSSLYKFQFHIPAGGFPAAHPNS